MSHINCELCTKHINDHSDAENDSAYSSDDDETTNEVLEKIIIPHNEDSLNTINPAVPHKYVLIGST